MADDLTAELADWGERFEEELSRAVAEECASLERSLSLLAAVEAVLKRHGPGRFTILGALCAHHEQHRFFSITHTEAADVEACPDCPASVYISCAGCGPQVRLDSCPDRSAITCALNGESSG